MEKPKTVYREIYKAPYVPIKDNYLPVLKHIPAGAVVTGAQVKEVGILERDGKQVEYQDIRVYINTDGVQS